MTTKPPILEAIHAALAEAFGPRLRGVILFGSEARGTARSDSDIDVLVLLDGKVCLFHDMKAIARVVLPLEETLVPPRIIDATPVPYEDFLAGKWALYRTAKKEGIAA